MKRGGMRDQSDERRFEPKHAIASARKCRVKARIGVLTLAVIRAIDPNHETLRVSREVRDEAPERSHLPAKEGP